MREGIDVSHWNGIIDWARVRDAGKQFAVIASGDGTFLDPRFHDNLQGACVLPFRPQIYHYIRLGLPVQYHADLLLQRLDEAQDIIGGPTVLWLDLEDTSQTCESMSVMDRQIWMNQLVVALRGSLPCLGIYTAAWWWPRMGYWALAKDFPLWVAQYCARSTLNLPLGWEDFVMWQYTSTGHVDGISGYVDLNVMVEKEDAMEDPRFTRFLEKQPEAAAIEARQKAWLSVYGVPALEAPYFLASAVDYIWRLRLMGWTVEEPKA